MNKDAIIAIWNDDGDLEEIEVKTAVSDVRNDAQRGLLKLPNGLSFVMYSSCWVSANLPNQLHCSPFRPVEQSHMSAWQHELEASTVNDLIARALR